MTVVSVTPDPETLTLTLVADLAAAPERAWQLWADAAQLGRWWGPPEWPATFVDHDLSTGGSTHYWMTGPEGEQAHGGWRIVAAEPPARLEIEDYFADADGVPVPDMPLTRMVATLEPGGSGTTMTLVSTFATAEQMAQLTAMGMVDGLTAAIGQIDAILAEG